MYGRITRVNTGKLNMLGYGINQDFTITGNSVHFYFFGILNKFTHNDRVFFRNISCQL